MSGGRNSQSDVGPARPAGGEREGGDAIASGGRAHLGVGANVADEYHLIHAAAHFVLLTGVTNDQAIQYESSLYLTSGLDQAPY